MSKKNHEQDPHHAIKELFQERGHPLGYELTHKPNYQQQWLPNVYAQLISETDMINLHHEEYGGTLQDSARTLALERKIFGEFMAERSGIPPYMGSAPNQIAKHIATSIMLSVTKSTLMPHQIFTPVSIDDFAVLQMQSIENGTSVIKGHLEQSMINHAYIPDEVWYIDRPGKTNTDPRFVGYSACFKHAN